MIIALSAYDWEWNTHYLYHAKEMPDKKDLDHMWKIAYLEAKSKVKSGIRTEPNPDEILEEMVKLLKENGIYPLKVLDYDVENKEMREEDNL